MKQSSYETMIREYRQRLSDARAVMMGKADTEAEKQLVGYLYDEAIGSIGLTECFSCSTEAFVRYGEGMKPIYPWLLFLLLGLTVLFLGLGSKLLGLISAIASVAFYAFMFALQKKNAPVAEARGEVSLISAEFSGFTQNRLNSLSRQSEAIHDLLEQQKETDALRGVQALPELYSFLFEEAAFSDSAKYAADLCEGLLRSNDMEPVTDFNQYLSLFRPVIAAGRSGVLHPAIRRISSGETVLLGERFIPAEEETR